MASSKTVVVKYERNGATFEIFVDSDLAYEYLSGKGTDPLRVLEVDEVFKDARKGERQSEDKIRSVFGTSELQKVVEIMLKNGNVPTTTEQRNRSIEEKRKQIVSIIAKNSIDPRTNAPNPPLRIENAMREAKVSVDPFRGANDQIDAVVKKISSILPIKFTTIKIGVVIPPMFANRCYGILKQYGLKSEKWLDNGSLQAVVEFPAGMQAEFFDRINKSTSGQVETKIIET